MNTNPPIKGHALIGEGHAYMRQRRLPSEEVTLYGGCECGYQPIDWKSMSIAKVKAWHRRHKEDIRSGAKPEVVGQYVTCDARGPLPML